MKNQRFAFLHISNTNILLAVLTVLLMVLTMGVAHYVYALDKEVVTFTINYYYYDEQKVDKQGERPYPAFVANMPKGSTSFAEAVPIVPGYLAYDSNNPDNKNLVDKTIITFDETKTVNIYYYPSDVGYTIGLYKQKLDVQDYEENPTIVISNKGKTGSVPIEFDNPDYLVDLGGGSKRTLTDAFDGFTLMYREPDVIAADGTTEFKCYYDRMMYTVHYDLNGGYGLSDLRLAYESAIVHRQTPHRNGYEFDDWEVYDNSNPDSPKRLTVKPTTMPNYPLMFRAKWKDPQKVEFTVVYKNIEALDGLTEEQANNRTYNYWTSFKFTARANADISFERLKEALKNAEYADNLPYEYVDLNGNTVTDMITRVTKDAQGHDIPMTKPSDFAYFEFDDAVTDQRNQNLINNNGKVTVAEDGTSVITLFYRRKSYTLRYVYARGTPDNSVSTREIDALGEISTDRVYLLDPQVVSDTNSLTDSQYGSRLQISSNNLNQYCWRILPQSDGTYYIALYNLANSDTLNTYLNINTDSLTVSSTPQALQIQHFTATTKDFFRIYRTIDGTDYYLTVRSSWGTYYAVSSVQASPRDVNNRWSLYEATPNYSAYHVAKSTGNGGYGGCNWGYSVRAVPSVSDLKNGRLKQGVMSYNNYALFYVELTAEYGENIESIWPSAVVDEATHATNANTKYDFGSWGVSATCGYRQKSPQNANIIGNYPYMTQDMIENPSNPIAQTMFAWWARKDENVSAHRYKIYLESVDYFTIDGEQKQTAQQVNDAFAFTSNNNGPGTTGNYFVLDEEKSAVFTAAHNGNTRADPFEYKGFTIVDDLNTVEGAGKNIYTNNLSHSYRDSSNGNIWTTDFYYTRNRYKITFYNNGEEYGVVENIKYGARHKDACIAMYGQDRFEYFHSPSYPSNLPEGKYEFDTWYTTPNFLPEDKSDPNSIMPDHDVVLYAHWVPKKFNVYFYNEGTYQEQIHEPIQVSYGSTIDEEIMETVKAGLNPPIYTSGGVEYQAEPANWFYRDLDTGETYAFDPTTMAVTDNMRLYMTWNSSVPTKYTVHYCKKPTSPTAEPEKIADDTEGYSFVGLTRTFKAKTGTALKTGYETRYFPDRASTSILLKQAYSDNQTTFYYQYRDNVPYKVAYIYRDTDGTAYNLNAPQTDAQGNVTYPVLDLDGDLESIPAIPNTATVVTEKFKFFEGYVPSTFYNTLILSVGEEADGTWNKANLITFVYTKDDVNIPYHIKYFIQDDNNGTESYTIDGTAYRFREVNAVTGTDEKGSTWTFGTGVPITQYSGYTLRGYQDIEYLNNVRTPKEYVAVSDPEALWGVHTYISANAQSYELYLYYTVNEYPTRITYKVTDSNAETMSDADWANWRTVFNAAYPGLNGQWSADGKQYEIKGKAQFHHKLVGTATDTVSGYRLLGSQNKSKIVVAETDPDNARMNVITFEYATRSQVVINYKAMIPERSNIVVMEGAVRANGLIEADISQEETKLLSQSIIAIDMGVRPNKSVEAYVDNDNYVFKGWYQDAACTLPLTETYPDNQTVTPPVLSRSENNTGSLPNVLHSKAVAMDMVYYAKFDLVRGSLRVNVMNDGGEEPFSADPRKNFVYQLVGTDPNNRFVNLTFEVHGEDFTRLIRDLPIGNYQVTQTSWTWRFRPKQTVQTVQIVRDTQSELSFEQQIINTKWLNGESRKDNRFGG